MCSFIVTTLIAANFTAINNNAMKRRGPDGSHLSILWDEFLTIHNLLALTGDPLSQPMVDRDLGIAALFNGEIYNYKSIAGESARSDVEALIGGYQQYGAMFPRFLDGEFAAVLIDKTLHRVILSVDPLGTKPLYYSLHDGGIHIATYSSALLALAVPIHSIIPVLPNSIIVFGYSEGLGGESSWQQLGDVHSTFEFDLRQWKNDSVDWEYSFLSAVEKRGLHSLRSQRSFVGLSSGLDSGAVHLAMDLLNIPHSVINILGEEDREILIHRLLMFNTSVTKIGAIDFSILDFLSEQKYVHNVNYVEPYEYNTANWAGTSVAEDVASAGLSMMARTARKVEFGPSLVYMSGSGSDEIISDYGFNGTRHFPHSSFGGKFPKHLDDIFPWESFFLGTQRDYIMKEETVGGSHGIEARYPFLDKHVVQEFLWLTNDVKNSAYKSVVTAFLKRHNFPMEKKKRGFGASRSLRAWGHSVIHSHVPTNKENFLSQTSSNVVEENGELCESSEMLSLRSALVSLAVGRNDNFELTEYRLQNCQERINLVLRTFNGDIQCEMAIKSLTCLNSGLDACVSAISPLLNESIISGWPMLSLQVMSISPRPLSDSSSPLLCAVHGKEEESDQDRIACGIESALEASDMDSVKALIELLTSSPNLSVSSIKLVLALAKVEAISFRGNYGDLMYASTEVFGPLAPSDTCLQESRRI